MALVCPLDFRYGYEEMKKIFSEEERLKIMLNVEYALAKAHADVGNIERKYAEQIHDAIGRVNIDDVKEIEKITRHDVMAMVEALSREAGKSGKHVHLGATSNDITDTATAIQMKRAIENIENDCVILRDTLINLAIKHKDTLMLGRTHGQSATPITFGLKLAVFASEMKRHIDRIGELKNRAYAGKMMGAVGTGAALGANALRIQEIVMNELGLYAEDASTQVIQRDRYVEIVMVLANIATSMEKFATEMRNLQRTEISEVAESFGEGQVGSSTMPHKRNPVMCENICGLARVIRSFVTPMMESAILWHERDLTNSASERFIIPHTFILLDYILRNMNSVFSNLVVNKEKMLENLNRDKSIMSEAIMIALVSKGMGRQEAHELMMKINRTVYEKKEDFLTVLNNNDIVNKYLSKEDISQLILPENYIGCSREIIERIAKSLR